MTKSIVITYQEADESFLMTFFKKFGIITNPFKNIEDSVVSPQPVAEVVVVEESIDDLVKRLNQEHEDMGILPPRKKIDLTKLFGTFNNKMTVDEIDSLTKSWRNEWDRDFC